MTDPFELDRFVAAQGMVYASVLDELGNGRKQSHWMWFVFPQIDGLGASATTRRYAIRSVAEATAYLAHPLLGPRLIECTTIVNEIEGRSVHDVFGFPDDLKFHSSMTLFALVDPGNEVFDRALDKYFGGEADPRTVAILANLRA